MDEMPFSSPLSDPEAFARVWRRVMPEADQSPLRIRPPEGESTLAADPEPPLSALLEGLSRSISACRRMARRGDAAGRTLAVLSTVQRQSLSRLTVLYYLRTGRRFRPSPAPGLPRTLPELLRWEYLFCRRLEALTGALVQREPDPCFRDSFRQLEAEAAHQAALLCALPERYFLPS